jgi:hypothetical protein
VTHIAAEVMGAQLAHAVVALSRAATGAIEPIAATMRFAPGRLHERQLQAIVALLREWQSSGGS